MRISSSRRILRNLFWCLYGYHFHVLTDVGLVYVLSRFLCFQVGLYVHKEIIACYI
jgi:hypothetical protein